MKLDVKFDQSSDWRGLRVAIDVGKSLGPHLQKAVLAELQFIRREVIKVFETEGPEGAAWPALSPITIAVRRFKGFRGTKPLQATRDLIASINVVSVPEGGGFVGVARAKARKDGRSNVNIAALQEGGFSARVPFGPKQRRFLFAALHAAGMDRDRVAGAGPAPTTVQIRVPPRPFLGPTMERLGKPEELAESIMTRLTSNVKVLGRTGSKPRE